MNGQKSESRDQTIITILAYVIIGLLVILFLVIKHYHSNRKVSGNNQNAQSSQSTTSTTSPSDGSQTSQSSQASTNSRVTCVDVTSYDYNWNNDILCTNPDGSTFYTSYAGADKYGYNF